MYRGRFAPSPTGPLHFGSLYGAIISYLEARANQGEWLLRIEDIDPPREAENAKSQILTTLKAHGLHFDLDVIYQSDRSSLYESNLKKLKQLGLSYRCPCSRKQLQENNGQHSPNCIAQRLGHLDFAIKYKASHSEISWNDAFKGKHVVNHTDDFVLKRKDGLYAYQLAVVSDDIEQQISHVIRGVDLLDSTPLQLRLYQALGHTPPVFGHFPVITDSHNQKLSKQSYAKAIDDLSAIDNLNQVFTLLSLSNCDPDCSPELAMTYAVQEWSEPNFGRIRKQLLAQEFVKLPI